MVRIERCDEGVVVVVLAKTVYFDSYFYRATFTGADGMEICSIRGKAADFASFACSSGGGSRSLTPSRKAKTVSSTSRGTIVFRRTSKSAVVEGTSDGKGIALPTVEGRAKCAFLK